MKNQEQDINNEKYKKLKNMAYNSKGINLIAVVIIISLLLVLAGIVIKLMVNKDKLFGKENEAVKEINLSNEKAEHNGTNVKTVIAETSNIAGVEKERVVPIPIGYTVSLIEGENTISEGLVIYQIPEGAKVDWENNTITISGNITNLQETVNQYVWIPVDDINSMVMCKQNAEGSVCNLELQENEIVCKTHGYSTATELTTANIDTTGLAGRLYNSVYSKEKETISDTFKNEIYQTDMDFSTNKHTFVANPKFSHNSLATIREPDVLTDDNTEYLTVIGIEASNDKTEIQVFKEQLNNDFIAMAKSVAKYGGFYISRYEVGKDGDSKKNQLVLTGANTARGNYLPGYGWYRII